MVFETFSPKMQALLKKKGFIEPTLPQKLGIPHIMKGKNVLVIAPTGSGKTETVCLPLFDVIASKKEKPISMLYVNPLRSLSRDLLDRLYWFADQLDLEVAVRHGDTPQSERKMQSTKPPDILITTPETLGAMFIGKNLREHLKNVKYVVVDEVHEILDNKRGVQLTLLLERLKKLAGDFQRIGLSATVGDPKKVAQFLGKNVTVVRAEAAKKYDISVEMPLANEEHKHIADELYIGDETTARLMRLRDLIKSHRSVLTFTNTRETAEVLSSRFRKIDKELKQEVHHGSLSKESRISSEKKFKNEEIKALIATSSLELGIDIGSIDLVVQYLSPRQVSKLIQRVGRSGHKISEVSKGIILTGEEDVFESVVIAKKAAEREIEDVRVHDMALDVLAGQVAGLALEYYDVKSSEVYNIIKDAYPFRSLSYDKFLELVRFLGSVRSLYLTPIEKTEKSGKEVVTDYIIKRGRRTWEYYYGNLSTIPDTRQMRIVSIVENEPIGSLDEAFVAEHCESGNTFVCKGRAWRVIQVEENRVVVEPVEDIESAIPAWEGELIPVPFAIAQGVGNIRNYIAKNLRSKNLEQTLMKNYSVDESAAREMISFIKKQSVHFIPDNENYYLETTKDFIILHSSSGTLINDTIGRYVAAMITAETGVAVNMKVDPYRIIFQTTASVQDIKRILEESSKLEKTLELALERSSMFKWRFLHVAKRFGIITKSAKFDKMGITKIIAQYQGTPVHEETMREVFVDKMDIEGAEQLLKKIKSGSINIHIEKGLSPLGENGLIKQFSEVMKPKAPEGEIFESFRRRLLHTQIRLVCTNCGDYSLLASVVDVEEKPFCPKCHSGLIGVVNKGNRKGAELVKRWRAKKDVSKEKKELDNVRRSAELVMVYGKKAVFTLAARGVGPETCARILARLPKDEGTLLKYIFEAEKQFVKTKIYWKA